MKMVVSAQDTASYHFRWLLITQVVGLQPNPWNMAYESYGLITYTSIGQNE